MFFVACCECDEKQNRVSDLVHGPTRHWTLNINYLLLRGVVAVCARDKIGVLLLQGLAVLVDSSNKRGVQSDHIRLQLVEQLLHFSFLSLLRCLEWIDFERVEVRLSGPWHDDGRTAFGMANAQNILEWSNHRSEERSVGKGGGRTGKSQWEPN